MPSRVTEKPKLLVVTSTFPRWENDTDPPFVYELSKRLTDLFDITVHTPHFPGAETKEVMAGIRIHRFRYFFAPFEKLAGSTGILPTLRRNKLYYVLVPFFLMAQFLSLLFLVRKLRPDTVHAHWVIPQGFVTILVQFFYRIPVIVTAHGADIFGLKGLLFKMIKKFTLRRVQGCTVVSNALAEATAELAMVDIGLQIIPMGVDSKHFSPDKKNEVLKEKFAISGSFLLYVGRLTEKKGVRYLVDTMPLVLKKNPEAKLIIVGSGELGEDLKQHVVKLGLNEQIQFTGSVPYKDLPKYYATADIFIGPSIVAKSGDTEGFGLTFVEAAMSGCLVIASDIGGIRDIIQDNETGFLVDPLDKSMFADRINYALQPENDLSEIRKNARRHCIEKFEWEVIAGKYMKLFKELICQRM